MRTYLLENRLQYLKERGGFGVCLGCIYSLQLVKFGKTGNFTKSMEAGLIDDPELYVSVYVKVNVPQFISYR